MEHPEKQDYPGNMDCATRKKRGSLSRRARGPAQRPPFYAALPSRYINGHPPPCMQNRSKKERNPPRHTSGNEDLRIAHHHGLFLRSRRTTNYDRGAKRPNLHAHASDRTRHLVNNNVRATPMNPQAPMMFPHIAGLCVNTPRRRAHRSNEGTISSTLTRTTTRAAVAAHIILDNNRSALLSHYAALT